MRVDVDDSGKDRQLPSATWRYDRTDQTPFTERASSMNRSACSGLATTPTSRAWPAYTATSTRPAMTFGSAMNVALIFSLSSRSLANDGRDLTKNVSTRVTPGVARAIWTAAVPAGEPSGTTPASTTTP